MTGLALDRRYVTFTALLVVAVAGLFAYRTMPQAEDPGFTIRVAMVTTLLPGASPERVEQLVTDPLEEMIQQIPELDFVTSESKTGASFIYVNIQERYREMRPIFDDLRRKVDDVRGRLPAGVIGPRVDDEFGDVFGIIYTITGEGFSYAELKEVADATRDELLRLADVAKVDIYGAQEERVFIEYDNTRLAQIGLSPAQLQQILAGQNIIFPGGNVNTGRERLVLEPTGNFESLAELRRTVIGRPGGGALVYLEDIADVRRGYVEPRRTIVHSSGVPALGLGVSMRDGGNIIRLGEESRALIRRLQETYPVGIEFDTAYFQPREVADNVDSFVRSLLQAVAIVVAMMLLFLGVRTGLVVATLIPMAILAALALMQVFDISLNTISIAALIISLGLLVDNAIVMSESMLVAMEAGRPAREAALAAARELKVPLLTSSLTTAAAFLPIYLAQSSTGEYTQHLFMVVTITLLSSWLLSLTMIPLLCVMFVRARRRRQDAYGGYDTPFYRRYRRALLGALRHRWLSLGAVALLLVGSLQLGRVIPVLFFPSADRAFLRATLKLPVGTPIDVTEDMVTDLEGFLRDGLTVGPERPEGILNWMSFIGSGSPRFTLSAVVDPPQEELAKLLINTTSRAEADRLRPVIERWLWDRYPDLDAVVLPLDYGPPVTAPVAVRVSGRDADAIFDVAEEIRARLATIPGARNVTDDWGPRVKKLRVEVDQPRARRAGVSSFDVALSLQTILGGLDVTEFREDEDVIPVVMRTVAADRRNLDRLESLDVFSQATGRPVPLKQVADIEVAWEPSVIHRRDRLRTVTISAYTDPGVTAVEVIDRLDPFLAGALSGWPLGTHYEYGGEIESSEQANASILTRLPVAFLIILLLMVVQFNHWKGPLIIMATIPLALIGVFVGLAVLGGSLGFMTFLGVISLAGIVINNAIVLLDRIEIEIRDHGRSPRRAVIESAQRRLRPILLTTGTTLGGLLPLYFGGGPMWESMAIAIMSGLVFATALTLGVVPILYSLLNRLSFRDFTYGGEE